jgi:hypothetical protein
MYDLIHDLNDVLVPGTYHFSDCGVESACVTDSLISLCEYLDICLIKVLCFQVSGKDPGYGLTCVTLLLTAITILRESDKMPGR